MKVYTKDLYEELYAGGMKVCKKNDAYAQFQLLVKELFAMGKNYEKVIFKFKFLNFLNLIFNFNFY